MMPQKSVIAGLPVTGSMPNFYDPAVGLAPAQKAGIINSYKNGG
jgi:hypothetical protein